jgi:hypothetical protein
MNPRRAAIPKPTRGSRSRASRGPYIKSPVPLLPGYRLIEINFILFNSSFCQRRPFRLCSRFLVSEVSEVSEFPLLFFGLARALRFAKIFALVSLVPRRVIQLGRERNAGQKSQKM